MHHPLDLGGVLNGIAHGGIDLLKNEDESHRLDLIFVVDLFPCDGAGAEKDQLDKFTDAEDTLCGCGSRLRMGCFRGRAGGRATRVGPRIVVCRGLRGLLVGSCGSTSRIDYPMSRA